MAKGPKRETRGKYRAWAKGKTVDQTNISLSVDLFLTHFSCAYCFQYLFVCVSILCVTLRRATRRRVWHGDSYISCKKNEYWSLATQNTFSSHTSSCVSYSLRSTFRASTYFSKIEIWRRLPDPPAEVAPLHGKSLRYISWIASLHISCFERKPHGLLNQNREIWSEATQLMEWSDSPWGGATPSNPEFNKRCSTFLCLYVCYWFA